VLEGCLFGKKTVSQPTNRQSAQDRVVFRGGAKDPPPSLREEKPVTVPCLKKENRR
jgi:hypothetical protein